MSASAAAGRNAADSSRYRKLEVASTQNSSRISHSHTFESLAWLTVAAPAATRAHGWRKGSQPGGGPRRGLAQPAQPGRGLARESPAALLPDGVEDQRDAQGQFDGQDRGRGRGGRRGWLAPGEQDHGADHHDQAGQPAQDEGQAFPGALLRAQDQQERDEREGLKRDAQADQEQVKYHLARLSSSTPPLH